MIISPLTRRNNIKKILEIDSNVIVMKYKRDINIDVKRFFEKTSIISLYECLDSGYKFYYPFSSIGDGDFYKDLSLNRKNYYSNRWEHKESLRFINKEDKLLEIGSGFGTYLNLLKKNNVSNIKGLELNSHAVIKCKEEGLDVEQVLIENEANLNGNLYDVVCSFQVLEHVVNVNDFIKASLDVLRKNGKLIIGVPNNNPYLFVNDRYHTLNLPPHHAGLWNRKSLKSLESIFNINLESLIFEPLENSYDYFIGFQIKSNPSFVIRKGLFFLNKFFPIILKKILCKFFNGRNVLAIFNKLDDE
ncbi:methyltransferase family protein [Flavobacterium cutihirudinis]|uniref:Methyltransferase family protein n=1 Tax=Flavobacterium cutihirudinis TaxID=1265740 RepID=A0A3D9FKJ4_9FLAO|nr:class I SAM-dependent methyltransferase [Flavobacterium cutihirudinis]RED19588.1 methyltransferase family protein [Flavobacterium cutihirudinis]